MPMAMKPRTVKMLPAFQPPAPAICSPASFAGAGPWSVSRSGLLARSESSRFVKPPISMNATIGSTTNPSSMSVP